MVNPGPEHFLLFYMKRRIEYDGKMQWFEAPYCCEENPPAEWDSVEKAAILFERDHNLQMQQAMIKRLETEGNLNYRGFRYVLQCYMDILMTENSKPICRDRICCDLILAVICFTGVFARRLAELDASQQPGAPARDFRREIYQVSIYGTRILSILVGGSWKPICEDVARVMK
jgi:hypothetical protein